MKGFNRAIIAGNLARDPEVRYTVNKRAFARFAVAVNYGYKDSNGEYKEGVDYINVVVWGPMAENCGKYLRKGSAVLLEGRIQTSSYDARDGSGKKYMTEINADNIQFLSSGQGQQGGNQQGFSSGSSPQPQSQPQRTVYNDFPSNFVPADEDFGKSIGESGFGGFPSGNLGGASSDEGIGNDIPF